MDAEADVVARWSRAGLEAMGFQGFWRFADLKERPALGVAGVYVVLREAEEEPIFLERSVAGWFKGRDPSVGAEVLARNWVAGVPVVYVGKAGRGPGGGATLKSRLNQYCRFGAGEPVGHWGGRFVFQLADHGDLLVAWLPSDERDPEEVETELLAQFAADFGVLPFANLRGGRTRRGTAH